MEATVGKWGNSPAIRISRAYAADAGIAIGDAVDLTIEGGRLVIRKKSLTLQALLDTIPPDLQGGESDWGADVGEEIIP